MSQPDTPAIALVDASGSTSWSFVPGTSVFDQMRMVMESLPVEHWRVLFWSSVGSALGPNGYLKFPHVIARSQLSAPFGFARPKTNGGTYAEIGFQNIGDWLAAAPDSSVYLITDGETGDGNALPIALRAMFKNYPDVQLHLVTVEPRTVNFEGLENIDGLVGADVYKTLKNNRLTDLLSSFLSVTQNEPTGHFHIKRVRAPPGFVAFRDRLFPETDMAQLVAHVRELTASLPEEAAGNEAGLLSLVQDLSTPLAKAMRDKPYSMRMGIVHNFVALLASASKTMDRTMLTFLLSNGCMAEVEGQAQLLSDFRSQLKSAFKFAQTMLEADVANACAMSRWMSLPLASPALGTPPPLLTIVTGTRSAIACDWGKFKNGGTALTGPVLPLFADVAQNAPDSIVCGGMPEQCTRQWVRGVCGSHYGVPALNDIIIYLVMGLCAQVNAPTSTVPDDVKAGYRTLARIMLRKQRLNSMETEWDRLERGDVPTLNNGTFEDFQATLSAVATRLGMEGTPWQALWRAMCLPLGLTAQARYYDPADGSCQPPVTWVPCTHWAMPETVNLEYKCIITLEDTSATGGFRFLQHTSNTGYACRPMQVLSVEGYTNMLAAGSACVCPVCYKELDDTNFEQVCPRAACSGQPELTPVGAPKAEVTGASDVPRPGRSRQSQSTGQVAPSGRLRDSQEACVKNVVYLRGTVGCGKSTLAHSIQQRVQQAGKTCEIASVDAHVATGMSFPAAIEATKAQIGAAQCDVLIVDTCGDQLNKSSIFGRDFSGTNFIAHRVNCDRQPSTAMLAWCLRNVLQRPAKSDGAAVPFSLCPASAGASKCVDVWKRKGQAVYGKKQFNSAASSVPTSVGTGLDAAAAGFVPHDDTDAVMAKLVF